MKAKDVKIGDIYAAKVSGNRTTVRIANEHPTKGWEAVNLATGRTVRILTAARLRPITNPKPEELAGKDGPKSVSGLFKI